jgi:hypothetical protein
LWTVKVVGCGYEKQRDAADWMMLLCEQVMGPAMVKVCPAEQVPVIVNGKASRKDAKDVW